MIDTGIWRNIGERPWAVREHAAGEMFYANYSDGLCDVDLTDMTAAFRSNGKIACFIAVRPSYSLHLVEAPFQRLIEADQLMAFRHEGFWRPMDTLKGKQILEDLVEKGGMPWHLNGAPRFSVSGAQRKIQ
jgi:glucose-1-phosphate cytidylyltransferase